MLPDMLLDMDSDEAISYATILAVAATCDGDFSLEEMSAYEARLASLLYQRDVRKRLGEIVGEQIDIDLHLNVLSPSGIKLLLRDIILMAACDGKYNDEEMKLIKRVAQKAGVDDETLNQLYVWVLEGWGWFDRGHQILGMSDN
tara:strand:- start:188 stop:619 length:432 start_codon:yes stop_codon:yes gene_type:complete